MGNSARRSAIRRTWGQERRFSDVEVRVVFLLGSSLSQASLQAEVEEEVVQFGDIVQGSFTDSYYNNSIKTAMGLRWAVESCPRSRFYMFVDDDYYVSTRNVLAFLRNPVNYPRYLQEDVISFDPEQHQQQQAVRGRHLAQLVDFDLPADVRLWSGYVFPRSRPHRHAWSKWFVSLAEYPYNFWPPYVTAGCYVLSRAALVDMYYTSYYTQMFRFDDIWLGLVGGKAELEPLHSDQFHFQPPAYTVNKYKYVVASHGWGEPAELERVWNQQKQAGNA